MILKLSLFTIFFGIVVVGAVEDLVGFSAENVWISSKRDGTSKPVWIGAIQAYHDDLIESFSKFPSGPLLNEGSTVMTTFRNYLTKLIVFSNSNSTILSASSNAILEALSIVKIESKTPIGVIEEFYRVLPSLMVSYRGVVSNLSKTIGGLSGFVNTAMTELEHSFRNHMTEFFQNDERGLKKEVDFKPIAKHAQKLANTISLIATTTQNQCELGTSEVHGSLITLTLVLDHLMICFHGLSGCSQAVLSEQNAEDPVVVHGFYTTLGNFTSGITKSLDAITSPNDKNVAALSTSIASSTDILNSTLNNLFGALEGVALTAGEITQNISRNICGVTNKITNTLGGLRRPKIF